MGSAHDGERRRKNHARHLVNVPTIHRVDRVRLDYPNRDLREPLGDIIVWKADYGFECVASIAHRLFHGVSRDGKWLVMERYPLDYPSEFPQWPPIPENVRAAVSKYGEPSSVMRWGGRLYVYVHGENGYLRIALNANSELCYPL